MQIKICEYCNREYIPNNKTADRQRFCSLRCRKVSYYQHPKGNKLICKYCGKEFIPKAKCRISYCSRECGLNDYRKRNHIVKSVKLKQLKQIVKVNCLNCGNIFDKKCSTSKYCSEKCRYEFNKERCTKNVRDKYRSDLGLVYVKKICIECGGEFKTIRSRQIYCSIECGNRYDGRISKSLRRARIRGLQYDRINPIEIFVRDKWHCKICGIKTPKDLRGTIEDNAPELDHVTPVSKDGTHTKDNVQCLCRKCNNNKSDKINLQLQFA